MAGVFFIVKFSAILKPPSLNSILYTYLEVVLKPLLKSKYSDDFKEVYSIDLYGGFKITAKVSVNTHI